MKPSEALNLHREAIRLIVSQNTGANPRVFGSVLTHEDTEESDLDILIDPTEKTTLLTLARMENKLEELLHIKVDILTPRALPPTSRDEILRQALPI